MHRELAFLAVSLVSAAMPVAAEECGKNRDSIIWKSFMPQTAPKFRLGTELTEGARFDNTTKFATLVLATKKNAIGSIALVVGGKPVNFKPCQFPSFAPLSGYQGFELALKDIRRVSQLVDKQGPATLRVSWSKKEKARKLYVAAPDM